MKHTYTPPPLLRESSQRKSTADIQSDINLMRAIYATRRNENHRRHSEMVGWSLVIVAVGFPVLCAIAYLIAK